MESPALSLPARTRIGSIAHESSLPWQLVAVVFAATSVIIGLIWDISWHMTIGRDSFWTPAHLAIYTGGVVSGIACGYEVLRRSFFAGTAPTDGVTIWRYFNGPLGGWLCIWGATAMITSGPFDDWWHNAYGLDVKIISPPHAVLALGFIAILTGALVMAMAAQSRATPSLEGPSALVPGTADGTTSRAVRAPAGGASWTVAYTSGLVLTMLAIFTTEYADRVLMHSGIFFVVAAIVFPFALVSAGRAVSLRYPATSAALVYTAIMLVQLWILPLFPASPKLGPILQDISRMVPLDFPLLVIVPAFVIDLLLQRTPRMNAWLRALLLGLAFLAVFAAVQWPAANFLMSDASHNWFFRTDRFPYMVPTDWLGPKGEFLVEPMSTTVRMLGIAAVISMLSARAGLAWGNWLRSVRR
jgi:hypothetical protein